MNGRMTTLAVALLAGIALPANAPLPSPDAIDRIKAMAPRKVAARMADISATELRCLALNIYWEARGEPQDGLAAVAHVTLNRVGTEGFPNTICGVVHQGGQEGPCQFHWYCDDRADDPQPGAHWAEAQDTALRAAKSGEPDPTNGALYFHNRTLKPGWAQARIGTRIIGQHVFFRLPGDPEVAQVE